MWVALPCFFMKGTKNCPFNSVATGQKFALQFKLAMKPELKTPIAYYGGKQMMLNHILPKIPEHTTYAELFFGGGAVFWAKSPAK